MTNHKAVGEKTTPEGEQLVRTSVLVPREIDEALRELAARGAGRPLSWEIRHALTDYVQREQEVAAA